VIKMQDEKCGMKNEKPARLHRVWSCCILHSALLVLLLLAACGASRDSDPADTANTFFQLLSAGKTRQAYDSAAFTFQAGQSFERFEQTVHELGIANYSAITWTQRSVNEKEAKLDGEIVTKNGNKVPVAVTLVKSSGTWKLYALRTGSGKDSASPMENPFTLVGKGPEFNDAMSRHPIPPQKELVALTREVLLKLDDAVKRKDFTEFYASISDQWRNDVGLSFKRVERTYQPFIDAGADMKDVATVEPIFTEPPRITSTGLLIVNGYFPTQPNHVNFKLDFVYELPNWKLFGIDVALVRPQ